MKGRPPNILLIGVDSLRADRLGCYGYPRTISPHLDRFAAEGTLFEQYWSPHIPTTPGYGSMLTGKDCFGTGLVGSAPARVRSRGDNAGRATRGRRL